MPESTWGDYVEHYRAIPGPDLIYFGSQVGWSPSREGRREVGCRTCGGILVFVLADPDAAVPIPLDLSDESLALVIPPDDPISRGDAPCASCMRWRRDELVRRLMDREHADRGTNDPVAVAPLPGGTLAFPLGYQDPVAPSVLAAILAEQEASRALA